MARRRMISEELIYDEELNRTSIEAEHLFFRMLAVADDYGFLPANEYTLIKLANPRIEVAKKFKKYFDEILQNNLGTLLTYRDKPYFLFKPEPFDRINSYLISKRTKSEYTKISKNVLESENFLEITGISIQMGSTSIERYKYRDISKEHKEEETVHNLWITTYGKNPTPVENKFGSTLIEKFGYKKAKNILWTLNKNNFHTIAKMESVVNDKGEVILIDEKKNGTFKQQPRSETVLNEDQKKQRDFIAKKNLERELADAKS